jgi:hypothetical protein
MDRKLFTAPQRALASLVRNTRSNVQPLFNRLGRPALEHPAFSHPAEDHSIHQSLDLSFQQSIAISRLDREIIDNLSRNRCTHLQLS